MGIDVGKLLVFSGLLGFLALQPLGVEARTIHLSDEFQKGPFHRDFSSTMTQNPLGEWSDHLTIKMSKTLPKEEMLRTPASSIIPSSYMPISTVSSAATPSEITEEEQEAMILNQLQSLVEGPRTLSGNKLPSSTMSRYAQRRGMRYLKASRGLSDISRTLGLGGTFLLAPVKGSYISSRFGWRHGRHHSGTDFAAPTGTDILASASGQVTTSAWSGGYGNLIVIDHGNGLKTLYGHCSKLLVSPGQWVKQGDPIGKVGSTGHSTGPHLHYEVLSQGVPLNPEYLLFR